MSIKNMTRIALIALTLAASACASGAPEREPATGAQALGTAPQIVCDGDAYSYEVTVLTDRSARVACLAGDNAGSASYHLDRDPGTYTCQVVNVTMDLFVLRHAVVGADAPADRFVAKVSIEGAEVALLDCK